MPDAVPLALLDTALRAAALVLLAALGLLALGGRVRQPLGRVTAALAAGLALQLLAAAPAFATRVPAALEMPLVAISVGNAVLFWLFARALTDARFVPRRADTAAWALAAGASLLHCALATRSGGTAAIASGLALRLLPLVYGALALKALLARHPEASTSTRVLGGLVVGGGVAYVLAQQALRLGAPDGRLGPPRSAADAALLLAVLALVAWRSVRLDARGPWRPQPEAAERVAVAAPRPRPDSPADDHLAGALARLMAEEHAWRDEGLGIGVLAARLEVPEHRLRRLINGQLGHRNFNAYLNGLRLDDARAALADPARRAQPVLTIALASGFQSIGPFNRAFKAATGLTPTEFRRQKLAES